MDKIKKVAKKIKEDLSSLNDQEIETHYVKKAYKLTDEEISTVQFIFWLIYYTEQRLTKVLKNTLKGFIKCSDDSAEKIVDLIFDESYLGAKIKVFEKGLPKSKELKKFCDYYRTLNDIRNQIFHGRLIKDIKYKGKDIKERKVKERMMIDLFTKLTALTDQLKK